VITVHKTKEIGIHSFFYYQGKNFFLRKLESACLVAYKDEQSLHVWQVWTLCNAHTKVTLSTTSIPLHCILFFKKVRGRHSAQKDTCYILKSKFCCPYISALHGQQREVQFYFIYQGLSQHNRPYFLILLFRVCFQTDWVISKSVSQQSQSSLSNLISQFFTLSVYNPAVQSEDHAKASSFTPLQDCENWPIFKSKVLKYRLVLKR